MEKKCRRFDEAPHWAAKCTKKGFTAKAQRTQRRANNKKTISLREGRESHSRKAMEHQIAFAKAMARFVKKRFVHFTRDNPKKQRIFHGDFTEKVKTSDFEPGEDATSDRRAMEHEGSKKHGERGFRARWAASSGFIESIRIEGN